MDKRITTRNSRPWFYRASGSSVRQSRSNTMFLCALLNHPGNTLVMRNRSLPIHLFQHQRIRYPRHLPASPHCSVTRGGAPYDLRCLIAASDLYRSRTSRRHPLLSFVGVHPSVSFRPRLHKSLLRHICFSSSYLPLRREFPF